MKLDKLISIHLCESYFDLMTQLKPYDRWVLECMYDGPIPIEVIRGKLQSYEGENTNEINNQTIV